jgi:hypothetical protein
MCRLVVSANHKFKPCLFYGISGGKLAESGPCTVDLNTRWSAVTQYLLAHTFTIGSSAVLPLSGDMPPLTWVVS